MLLLEREVALALPAREADRGKVLHFYAVSSYVVQHPESMGYSIEALAAARVNLADHLAGRVQLAQLRYKVSRAAEGTTRVMRRTGDNVPSWPVTEWPVTVADVLSGGVEGYSDRVTAWAESIVRTLDAAET